jgi:very-short-patch-repair endonuclease
MRDERGAIDRASARRLRRDMTDAERRLWARLRNRGLGGHKIRRQHQIGPFIAAFCCEDKKLVIELDGGQHAEQVASDERRTAWLSTKGYRVIRFWNNDVLGDIEGVLEAIPMTLDSSIDPSPQPSPDGRGGATSCP